MFLKRYLLAGAVLLLGLFLSINPLDAGPPTHEPVNVIPVKAPADYVVPAVAGAANAVVESHVGQVSPVGVQMWTFSDSRETNALNDMGATWARFPVEWDVLEPTQGNYNWAVYDAALSQASANGIRLIVTIRDNPNWAATTLCGRIDKVPVSVFADRVQQIVARYSQSPYNVRYWELYNEPDNEDYVYRQPLGGCWGLFPTEYAQMLQTVAPAIKAADPEAKVVIGGLAMEWFTCTDATVTPTAQGSCDEITPDRPGIFRRNFLQRVIEAGGGPYFDIMNFHYYPNWRLRWEGYGTDIGGKAAFIRGILQSYGIQKEVIATELGAWSNTTRGGSDTWMSNYVAQVMARAIANDLGTAIWFDIRDPDPRPPELNPIGHGLLNYNASPKDAAFALRTFNQETAGAFVVRRLSAGELGQPEAEGYEFRGMPSGKKVWVVWSTPPFTTQRPYVPQDPDYPKTITVSRPTRWLGKLGSDLTSTMPSGDPVNLTITTAPSYLEYVDSDPPLTPTPTMTRTPSPTPTPTMTRTPSPTPTTTPAPVSVVVGPAGGVVPWWTPLPSRTPGAAGQLASNDFGNTTLLSWPDGAFDSGSVITYSYRSESPPPGRWSLQRSFLLYATDPDGAPLVSPATPVTLTVSYAGSSLGVTDEQTIALYRLEGASWITAGITATLDAVQDRFTGIIDRLGLFSLLNAGWQVRLPVVIKSFTGGW